MTSAIKNSEKLQEKLNKNYEVMSRKTAQQLKDVKKKVKDLKHQIDKVSSGQTNNINISSANLNSQFYVQKEHFDATRKSIDDARTKSKDGSYTKLSVSEETNGNVVNLDLNTPSKGGKNVNEKELKELNGDKFKRVREKVPEIECLIAKTILWNNTNLKKLDEDEVGLEDDIDKVSLIVRAFIEQYNQEAFCLNVKEQETSEKRLRKHSFIQKYLERRKISKTQFGNDNTTTTTKEEAGRNNEYGKYATIKQRNGNHLTTNQEIDQDDIGELEDDDNLQITSKLDLTGKFETATTSSAWVGPEIDFSISSSFRNIKHKNQSTKRTLGYSYRITEELDKLGNNGSNNNLANKGTAEKDDNQNIDHQNVNDNPTNLHSERPPKTLTCEKKEMGSPLHEEQGKVAKVRSTETDMSHFGQQTSAKNQTCDRGVWSWQDERIFLQVLYSIMNSHNSMNIYQGGMINIKSNDGNEDVGSNTDGGLMQNNKFDVCSVKLVERYGSFPKNQKQMYDTEPHASEHEGDNSEAYEEYDSNDSMKRNTNENVFSNGHVSIRGKDKSVSSGGGIGHGGQTDVSKHNIDRNQINCSWWYNSEKTREKFLHTVWSKTSGQINSTEQVEKHMNKWLKKQQSSSKIKSKIKIWKETKKNNAISSQICENTKDANEGNTPASRKNMIQETEMESYRKRTQSKLKEWKELKQIKTNLEESTSIIKDFSSRQKQKPKINYNMPSIHSISLSLSDASNKTISSQKKTNKKLDLDFLSLVHVEANSELIKSYQERDREMVRERKERASHKNQKSFEDIHPIRENVRFNSSQFLTSSMIDLSSYNNPTQSSRAKATVMANLNHRPNTATEYLFARKNVSMQIENVPRLRTPAWRTIS